MKEITVCSWVPQQIKMASLDFPKDTMDGALPVDQPKGFLIDTIRVVNQNGEDSESVIFEGV